MGTRAFGGSDGVLFLLGWPSFFFLCPRMFHSMNWAENAAHH